MSNISMVILPLLILFFLYPQPTICFSNHTDSLSLLAFKSSLKDPQGALISWNQTTHFCTWNGIQCGHRHRDRVVAINLMSQGLLGPLSPHVGNLSFLRTIILQNNTFHGQIPEEIGFLRRLEFVEFSNNSFIGPIPQNLSHCLNLVYLSMIDNELSGTIPTEFGSLPKLEALGLSLNKFSGSIPSFIGNITSLKKLSLGNSGFSGEIPESLAQLRKLELLQLGNNTLTGTIPSALFNMSALRYLNVGINRLHGVIPSTIGLTLPTLTRLHLQGNRLSGPIPASISNASLLEQINVVDNHLTGPIPRLESLTHLQLFALASNAIADDISFISMLTNSTKLEALIIADNMLSGSLPESIANLSTLLLRLDIRYNKIHGTIPASIGNLISLTRLQLSDNQLEGPIPMSITELYNLRELTVSRNKLGNELPSSLGNLTFLITLYLSENNFGGNVPSSVGNFTNLLDFDLSHNNFSGLIPREIMSLSSVSIVFNLSYNNFEGSIPYEVGSLTNLAILDLSNNRMSGLIPNSISRCVILQQLHLEGNLLEGQIPSGLSALTGLQDLDLSINKLSGPIPNFVGRLKLEKLNLSFNRLHGEVPVMGVFKNVSSVSLEGNQGLCGGIWELKLPPCSLAKLPNRNLSTLLKVLVPVLVVGGLICFMLLVFLKYKQRVSRRAKTSAGPSSIGVQFMRLSYGDLLKATTGFSESNLIGIGRFGSVFKGVLDDGQTFVAVKVLNLFVRGASKSFESECNALRGIRHRNLVKILSVCESIDFQGNEFKALVYEFKANGSLEKWLYHKEEEESGEVRNLSMIQRLNIAIDIARAIEYLHFGTDSSIVHGDLKPSNILLDHDMTACVGDFGLAKIISNIVPSHESHSSIGIRGTIGYVPPEYGTNHLVSMQGDVYSYGIVLLEMFILRRPTDDLFMDHVNLHNFVVAALPDQVMKIVDPQVLKGLGMNNDKIKDCLTTILSIGVSCSNEIPGGRMLINNVVNELHKIQKLLSR